MKFLESHASHAIQFFVTCILILLHQPRAVIKKKGPGIFPGYYGRDPWLILLENRRKIEPKGP